MKATQVLIFLTFFTIHACKNTNSGESPDTSGHSKDSIDSQGSQQDTQKGEIYYVWVDNLRLRKTPDQKGEILLEIAEGSEILYLNEKTDFTEKITLRGKQNDEPWLKVRSGEKTGWVYGGAVRKTKPRIDNSPSIYDACFEKLAKNDFDKFAECKAAAMEKQLKTDARFVEKTTNGYRINLLSGESRNLVHDLSVGEKFRKYEYMYYLDKMGYFVFRINFHEASQYLLMDDKYGYAKMLSGFPKPSPDFKNLVAANAGGIAGIEFNGIQMLGFTDQGLELLFEKEFDTFEPFLPKWIDEKTVEFQLFPLSVDKHRKPKKAMLRLNEGNQWELEE